MRRAISRTSCPPPCITVVSSFSTSVFVLNPRFAGYRAAVLPPQKKRCKPTNGKCGEGGNGGDMGKIPPKRPNGELWGKRESFEKKRENRTKRVVFILLGPIQIANPTHAAISQLFLRYAPVNYDEAGPRSNGGRGPARLRGHNERRRQGFKKTSLGEQDGATTGDDGKCQKTELSVTLRIQYPIDEPLLRKYAATSAANTVRQA